MREGDCDDGTVHENLLSSYVQEAVKDIVDWAVFGRASDTLILEYRNISYR